MTTRGAACPPDQRRGAPRSLVRVLALGLAGGLSLGPGPAGAATGPAIDPDVREAVRVGRARVLVELRLAPSATTADAIADRQRAVLEHLAGSDVTVVRRYVSLPLLALEIDAVALARLEALGEQVARVSADIPVPIPTPVPPAPSPSRDSCD